MIPKESAELTIIIPDACPRCERLFRDNDKLVSVVGENTRVAMTICQECVDQSIDSKFVGFSIYKSIAPGCGPPGVIRGSGSTGFLQIADCADGLWRIGLKRGYPELWTREEISQFGLAGLGSYGTVHERRRVFINLSSDDCLVYCGGNDATTGPYSAFLKSWRESATKLPFAGMSASRLEDGTVQLSDGTILDEGWICAKCDREFSIRTLGDRNRIPRGIRVGDEWWCSLCTANQDRPWMTALEMQFAALSVARKAASSPSPSQFASADLFRIAHDVAARLLVGSQPFAWSESTATAVTMASRTIPGDAVITPSILPDGLLNCFWWFESSLDFGFVRGPVRAINIAVQSDQQVILIPYELLPIDAPFSTYPAPLACYRAKPGTTLTSLARDIDAAKDSSSREKLQKAVKVWRFILAATTWLKQRIIVLTNSPIERHRRKQLAREHGAVVSDVKVIQLRRSESQPRHEDGGDHDSVEWSCRWIVNGHWRNQFHPSSGKHELKYILPHVKGPADKPLKVPTHTVYAVNR